MTLFSILSKQQPLFAFAIGLSALAAANLTAVNTLHADSKAQPETKNAKAELVKAAEEEVVAANHKTTDYHTVQQADGEGHSTTILQVGGKRRLFRKRRKLEAKGIKDEQTDKKSGISSLHIPYLTSGSGKKSTPVSSGKTVVRPTPNGASSPVRGTQLPRTQQQRVQQPGTQQQNAAARPQESAIMKHLEEMYKKDGRTMPNMDAVLREQQEAARQGAAAKESSNQVPSSEAEPLGNNTLSKENKNSKENKKASRKKNRLSEEEQLEQDLKNTRNQIDPITNIGPDDKVASTKKKSMWNKVFPFLNRDKPKSDNTSQSTDSFPIAETSMPNTVDVAPEEKVEAGLKPVSVPKPSALKLHLASSKKKMEAKFPVAEHAEEEPAAAKFPTETIEKDVAENPITTKKEESRKKRPVLNFDIDEPIVVQKPKKQEEKKVVAAPPKAQPKPEINPQPKPKPIALKKPILVSKDVISKPQVLPNPFAFSEGGITEANTLLKERNALLKQTEKIQAKVAPATPVVTAPVAPTPVAPTPVAPTLAPALKRHNQRVQANLASLSQKVELKTEPKVEYHDSRFARIAARKKLTGFKGFCPVTLRDNRNLADVKLIHRATYAGQIYHFSSEEAKAKFLAQPARYAPAFEGKDVVKYHLDGIEAPGRLDHSAWYRDKLFLFKSAENRQKFVASPSTFIQE